MSKILEQIEARMVVPHMNLNGSSGATLIGGYLEVERLLHDAIGALIECSPHGRDYQTQPPEDYQRARDEHRERVRALEKVRADVENLAIAIQHQQETRRR